MDSRKEAGEKSGRMFGVYLDGATLTRLEELVYTRQRTRNFLAAAALRHGLPLVARLKEFPEPKRSDRAPASLGIYVDNATIARAKELGEQHERKPGFLAAAAVRLGLDEVKRIYPAVRPLKRDAGKSKRAGAKGRKATASAAGK